MIEIDSFFRKVTFKSIVFDITGALNPRRYDRMKIKTQNISILIFLGFVLFAFFITTTCSAQLLPYNPFFAPFNPFFLPVFSPFVPPVPTFPAPVLNPALSPYTSLPIAPYRSAAATLIVLPPAAPAVTAYAPLGTLNLTPSTLIFLILYLTLPE